MIHVSLMNMLGQHHMIQSADYEQLAYIMLKDGSLDVIPVSVNLKSFTHVTIRGRRLGRSLLMKNLHFYNLMGHETPVFLLSVDEFDATDQEK